MKVFWITMISLYFSLTTLLFAEDWKEVSAKSVDLKVSVPGTPQENTINGLQRKPIYSILSIGEKDIKYGVLYIEHGAEPNTFDQFKFDLGNKSMEISKYKGYTVIYDKRDIQGTEVPALSYVMRLATKAGLYVLMISGPVKELETIKKNKDRFFTSLGF